MKKLWSDLRIALRQAMHDFRSRSKYFQYKVYIGVAYIVLLLVTVIAVVPKRPSNSLNAYVLAARGDFVVGSYVMVRNDSKKDWEKVKLTVNGSHTYQVDKLKAGEKVTVQLPKFVGNHPLAPEEVRQLKIECSRGQEVYAVSFAGGKR